MLKPLRVLVVGASIAGPTTAYWFARAGAAVTVVERFPALRTAGQAVDIRTAGVTVMRRMKGMEDAARAKSTTLAGVSFVNSAGRSFGTIRPTGNPEQQSLVSEYEIFRGDLAGVLFGLTGGNDASSNRGISQGQAQDDHHGHNRNQAQGDDRDHDQSQKIKYVFGEQVASIQQQENLDGPVTVDFMNGKLPTTEYDLVVACDGATSRTRALGLDCQVRDHVHPVNLWAAYFSLPGDLLEGSKVGHAYTAVGGRFIALGPDPDPAGVTRVTLMSVHPRKDHDAPVPFREAAAKGDEALKRYVAARFAGAGWKTDQVLRLMMDSASDFYASEIVQVKLPDGLSKGRFVLVGDAGYAAGPTGGGTTLALAGGYVLAGEICRHKGDIAAGLRGYEQTMRPIITDLQKIPPLIPAVLAPQTVWGIWVRNNIFRLIARSGIMEFAHRWFGNAFAEGDKYRLPEYESVRR
ncbi:oxidoreductase [Cladophialophora carrionii]|uniref:Oxidoreductase n=1 Tax=Cladophialophora carrionii TaxID=86049 RepID=A0A1C1CIC3_9EURO|nr:oxidoreductase [Cladophialophora carrionii]